MDIHLPRAASGPEAFSTSSTQRASHVEEGGGVSILHGGLRLFPQCGAHHLFEAQVQRSPSTLAVVCEGQSVTYEVLDQWANRVAHFLVNHGVVPGVLVGICIERSIDMIVAIIATWKAGAAYVPLDPSYPDSRLQQILADSRITLLLTRSTTKTTSFLAGSDFQHIYSIFVDSLRANSTDLPMAVVSEADSSAHERAAYVLYTSGSTGTPKGICIEHRSLVNYFHFLAERIDLSGLQRPYNALHVASIGFDASLKQLVHLLYGGTLYVLPDHLRFDLPGFFRVLVEHRIRSFDITPSLMKLMLEVFDPGRFSQYPIQVLLGGEAVDTGLWQALSHLPHVRSFNAYGPTECTVNTTIAEIVAGELPHIGSPLPNVICYVLDGTGRVVPHGAEGELWIGGAGVGRGYVNRSELNAERFLPNPFDDGYGEQIYRTGDLVRLDFDGRLVFLRRLDNQVKINGYRIELEEVESQLRNHPDVVEVAAQVIAATDRPSYLAAFFVPRDSLEATAKASLASRLRLYAALKLPSYLLPSVYIAVDSIPLTINGKVDRRSLAVPPRGHRNSDYHPPRNDLQAAIAQLWTEILHCDSPGIRDNFFQMGGTSLAAIRLANGLRERLGIDISVQRIFEGPTIEQLGDSLDCAQLSEGSRLSARTSAINDMHVIEDAPLSSQERAMWLLSRDHVVCVQRCIGLQGSLDHDALGRAVDYLLERHAILRTAYREADGHIERIVLSVSYDGLETRNISSESIAQQQRLIEQSMIADMGCLDPRIGQVFRVVLLQTAPQEYLLVLTTHHLVSDAVSHDILVRELSIAYEAYCADRAPPLSATTPYAAYSVWQQEHIKTPAAMRGFRYWQAQISELSETPIVLKSSETGEGEGSGWVGVHITPEQTLALMEFCERRGLTLFTVILAAISITLHHEFGLDEVCVDVPAEGRQRAEFEQTVGYFVQQLLLRNVIADAESFATILNRVKQSIVHAMAHQGELASDAAQFVYVLQRVHLILDIAPKRPDIQFQGLQADWLPLPSAVTMQTMAASASSTLMLFLSPSGGGYSGGFVYCQAFHEKLALQAMSQYFHHVLDRLMAEPDEVLGPRPGSQFSVA